MREEAFLLVWIDHAAHGAQTPSAEVRYWYREGSIAFSEHRYLAAIDDENRAISENPAFEPAYTVKGIALAYAYNDSYNAAMLILRQAISMNPYDGYGWFNIGLCNERYGFYGQGIAAYEHAIHLRQRAWWLPWAYYGIACIYGREGDAELAVKYLKEALKYNPKTILNAARSEQDFAPVRDNPQFKDLINS